MDKVILKYEGNGYRGRDQVTGQEIVCTNGKSVAVSAEKAAQLLKDYPKNFKRADAEGAADPKQEQKVTTPEPAEPKQTEPEPAKQEEHKPAATKAKAKAKPKAKPKKR